MLEHDIDRPAHRRQRLKVALVAAWGVALLAVLGVGGYVVLKPSDVTISGGLTLIDTDPNSTAFEWDEDPLRCNGFGGYSDINKGAGVTIKDASGKVVAVGALSAGYPGGIEESGDSKIATRCMFRFEAMRVPGDDFYSVEVSHRSPVTYTREQVAGDLQLTLGS